jgi:hypothetical protein
MKGMQMHVGTAVKCMQINLGTAVICMQMHVGMQWKVCKCI